MNRFLSYVIFLVYFIVLLVYKMGVVFSMPDEVYYTQGNVTYEGGFEGFNFYISQLLITYLYRLNIYLPLFVQSAIFFYVGYKLYNKARLVPQYPRKEAIMLLFMLPSFAFFTVSYLRDFYAIICVIIALYLCKTEREKFLFFILASVLRNEIGIILLLAYLFESIYYICHRLGNEMRVHYGRGLGLYRTKWMNFFIYLACGLIFMTIIVEVEPVFQTFASSVDAYERLTDGYGFFQVPITKENVLHLFHLQSLLYYAPYFVELFEGHTLSLFSRLMVVDGVISLFLFIRFFFVYRRSSFITDSSYRMAVIVIIMVIVLSQGDSLPSTCLRHRMIPMVFLFYLNFPIRKVAICAKSQVSSLRS